MQGPTSERRHETQAGPLIDQDGRPLEIKEGVVLDRDENPIPLYSAADEQARARTQKGSQIHVWRIGGLLAPVFLVGFFLLLTVAGFTVIGGFLAVLLCLWVLKLLFRLVASLFGLSR